MRGLILQKNKIKMYESKLVSESVANPLAHVL